MAPTSPLLALRHEMQRHGRIAYLLTVGAAGGPHCVAVTVDLIDECLVMSCGNRSLANATTRTRVTLLWPPRAWGEHSLIVDGEVVSATGTGRLDNRVVVSPGRAILHPTIDPADGLRSPADCVIVLSGPPVEERLTPQPPASGSVETPVVQSQPARPGPGLEQLVRDMGR